MSVNPTALKAAVSLDPVKERIEDTLGQASGELREASSHLFGAGGKGIRPTLVILSAQAALQAAWAENGNPPTENGALNELPSPYSDAVYDVAAAVEIVHVASLIHDDIIDGARLRREQSSVNARWNNHTAVLAGDYLFASAFNLLSRHASLGMVTLMTRAISEMCHGEILQRQQAFNPEVTEDAYTSRITGKTAALIAACCEAGARLGGASPDDVRGMRDFGHYLGLAYQLIDDILDIEGTAEDLGKPVGADLMEGNVTLPVIYLLKDDRWRSWLAPRLARKRVDTQIVERVQEGVRVTGAIQNALMYGEALAKKAEARLGPLGSTPAGFTLSALSVAAVRRKA